MGARDEHGTAACYQAGCRCDDCKDAKRAYRQACEQRRAEKLSVERRTVTELRIPVGCANCGGPLEQQAEGRPTDKGTRVSVVMRCASSKCRRQWLVITVMQSMSGHEFMGAA